MKRVLLTGGSGFVGANLARRLLRDGHEVHLLLRRGHSPWRLEGIRAELRAHEADLGEKERIESVVATVRPDWVFHLAAYGGYSWQDDVERILRVNFRGTVVLLEACTKVGFEAFVNAGSSSEYGFRDHAPRENELPEPNSAYAAAKAAATLYSGFLARDRALPVATLRLYSVYGPFEEPVRLVPTLILHAMIGKLPPLVSPWVARDFVHVDDVVEAFILAASCQGQDPGVVYNVGSGVQTTVHEIVEWARREFKLASEPPWGTMSNRAWDTAVWVSDPRRIRERLGWTPSLSLPEGLRKTAAWLRSHPDLLAYYERRVEKREERGQQP